MKSGSYWRTATLLAVACGVAGLLLLLRRGAPVAPKPNTASFVGLTNGWVGPMSRTFQGLSTNTAAAVQRWFRDGTNAAVLRITNHQNGAIWILPFTQIQTQSQPGRGYPSLILDAPNFSGVRIPAGQAAAVVVAIYGETEPWRVEVGYTQDESSGSLLGRLRHLPRDLRALVTRQPIVRSTLPISTDWIEPSAGRQSEGSR